jgi:hypothetical protein
MNRKYLQEAPAIVPFHNYIQTRNIDRKGKETPARNFFGQNKNCSQLMPATSPIKDEGFCHHHMIRTTNDATGI